MRPLLAALAAILLLAACGSSDDTPVAAEGTSATTSGQDEGAASPDGACDTLAAYTEVSAEIDGDDIESLQEGFAGLVAVTAELETVAPDSIVGAASDLHEWAVDSRETADDPAFQLDENVLRFWDTPESATAQQELFGWAAENCGDLAADVRPDIVLVLCLGPDATDEIFDAVKPRLEIPTGNGTEVELPEGIQGIAWDYAGGEIEVTVDRFISTAARDQLESDLSEPPVERIVEVEVPWRPQEHSESGLTAGCT